jgi:hypothetical protein
MVKIHPPLMFNQKMAKDMAVCVILKDTIGDF